MFNGIKTTGNSAVSYSFAPTNSVAIKQVRVHLSAAGAAGDMTFTLNSAGGTAYDVLVLSEDMTSVTDLIWNPNGDTFYIAPGDSFDIAWANASARTYGIEILYT